MKKFIITAMVFGLLACLSAEQLYADTVDPNSIVDPNAVTVIDPNSVVDPNSRPEDIAVAKIIDALPIEHVMRVRLYKCLIKPDFPVQGEDHSSLIMMFYGIQAGQVPMIKRVDGKYKEVPATFDDICNVFKLNRKYLPADKALEILMKLRCPLDGHLYADNFGVDPNE